MTRLIKRPVFIFYGNSCLCKSHIAALTGKTVYETDINRTLPDVISTDIIVVGNRTNFDIKDVEDRVFMKEMCEIIKVSFSK